jgi:hypothetical protein
VQIEFVLKEKKKKSTIGTNGGTNVDENGNGKKATLVNDVNEEEVDDINIIQKWIQRPQLQSKPSTYKQLKQSKQILILL